MRTVITKSWVFTAAQTDLLLETVGGSNRMAVIYAKATCANSNTGDVSVRVGFGATTLPTVSYNSATGMVGMFVEHGGIAPGGGELSANGGDVIATSELGVGPRLTCSAATGGSMRLVVAWLLLE